ncbi:MULTISPECIES: NAD(P)-dependent oxidoreductase [unclassified Lacticaseibacillus]|uniref:NAD(P)-dependent oxidoreductase n=1 Tax=unclassified Lacticaseibacillus TaxID=2759744 RepID=UPI001940EEB6|nr:MULTISPECIES: NAD(P)H-binding protein [unclassified Lacticaseibacillus]
MTKIGIIGATGHVGQAIMKEALDRGLQATAIVRSAEKAKKLFGDQAAILAKDAMALTQADLSDFDIIVDAFASAKPYEHVDLATRLISFFREDQATHLFFVIGASTLLKPDGSTLLTDTMKRFAGEPWLAGMIEQNREFEFLQLVDDVNWTAITPSTDFTDGPKTTYRVGGSHIINSAAGENEVSVANFAAALLDESAQPKHTRTQFSVVDA